MEDVIPTQDLPSHQISGNSTLQIGSNQPVKVFSNMLGSRTEDDEIRPSSGETGGQISSGVIGSADDGAPANWTAADQCHLGHHPIAHPYIQTTPHSTQPNATNLNSKEDSPREISGDGGAPVPKAGTQIWFDESMGNHSQAPEMQRAPFNS
ncbi:hypothetical protein HAX54_024516 [Datura stramonium]|uniref:Uncharacterized protein n=1 Tax=Datura stramonium TaxID=4076 RepID=A0ABS8UY55_DATST|nr:hypothetical protein [Datura stramonium]